MEIKHLLGQLSYYHCKAEMLLHEPKDSAGMHSL